MPERILPVVYNDRESETRTPSRPLVVIPAAARDELSAMAAQPAISTAEADLTRIAPGRPQAAGRVISVSGRIVDQDERPVRRSVIEIWNANSYGRYSHALDTRNTAPLDPYFYGFGRAVTDDEGVYRFQTIKPGAYIARSDIGWWRPPHVHFSLLGGGVRLVTQMYFPEEPLNEQDYIHMVIPEPDRPRVIATRISPAEFRFDIVTRGRYQTPYSD